MRPPISSGTRTVRLCRMRSARDICAVGERPTRATTSLSGRSSFVVTRIRPKCEYPTSGSGSAGAVEAYVYYVRFEGTSNSPCVPVSSNVIPGTTQPIAGRRADGTWFLLADGMVGFVDTCPGAHAQFG